MKAGMAVSMILIGLLCTFKAGNAVGTKHCKHSAQNKRLRDGRLPANPLNNQHFANAVTLKSTFCLP